jgi:hypothetical protein
MGEVEQQKRLISATALLLLSLYQVKDYLPVFDREGYFANIRDREIEGQGGKEISQIQQIRQQITYDKQPITIKLLLIPYVIASFVSIC